MNNKLRNLRARFFIFVLMTFLILVKPVTAQDIGIVISDHNFLTAEQGFFQEAIQVVLKDIDSPLVSYEEQVGGESLSAAETIWVSSQHMDFGLNPKVLFVTLYIEGMLGENPSVRFTPYVQNMAESLWEAYAGYQTGEREITLRNGQAIDFIENGNAATYALAIYFAPDFNSETELYDQLEKWRLAFQELFAVSPELDVEMAHAMYVIEPFLELPFEQPPDAYIKVNSFFDHASPGIFDDTILRFDGRSLGPADFAGCTIGVNCYGGHNGIDYKTGAGMPMRAAADGTVVYKYFNTNSSEGRVDSGLYIDHGNGYRTAYWHMDPILVSYGETVQAGQIIGLSGNIGMSSGPHLHFGLRIVDGNKPVDPFGWWNTTKYDHWGDSQWMWKSDLIADNREAQAQLFYNS
ncbi:MAG: M23 family metallopeptidase [Anaerolineaceae bacterium]|nr:M23 family metallopeptidase [Anaerolineaceae bacterium]